MDCFGKDCFCQKIRFTAEDCKRLTGTDTPDYYTTPGDWSLCKNLSTTRATTCWHPHCDCMGVSPMQAPSAEVFAMRSAATYIARREATIALFKAHFWSKFFK